MEGITGMKILTAEILEVSHRNEDTHAKRTYTLRDTGTSLLPLFDISENYTYPPPRPLIGGLGALVNREKLGMDQVFVV